MTVYESEVPGIGKKFEVELDDDRRLIAIIHHDGKRDVHIRDDPDADSEKLFTLSDELARQFGTILEGAYFQPTNVDDTAVPLGDAVIEWTTIDDDSPLAGQTLRSTDIRRETGASVIAVQRDEDTIPNPRPTTVIEVGDILVTLGTRDDQTAFAQLAEGSDEGADTDADTPADSTE